MSGHIAHINLPAAGQDRLPSYLNHEQKTACKDLITAGHFQPRNDNHGPYDLSLSIEDGRLVIRVRNAAGQDLQMQILSLRPYSRLISDYFMIIESHEKARREATPDKLEALDMARRSLHDEGAEKLQSRLHDKIDIDHETARKLFTLICTLHKAQMRHII